jgi:hypothetical protein
MPGGRERERETARARICSSVCRVPAGVAHGQRIRSRAACAWNRVGIQGWTGDSDCGARAGLGVSLSGTSQAAWCQPISDMAGSGTRRGPSPGLGYGQLCKVQWEMRVAGRRGHGRAGQHYGMPTPSGSTPCQDRDWAQAGFVGVAWRSMIRVDGAPGQLELDSECCCPPALHPSCAT